LSCHRMMTAHSTSLDLVDAIILSPQRLSILMKQV